MNGAYNLTRKIWKLQVNTAPLKPLLIPPAGWKVVSANNYQDFADKLPQTMSGTFTKAVAV